MKCLIGSNCQLMTFDIQKVKGQPNCEVVVLYKNNFLAIIYHGNS